MTELFNEPVHNIKKVKIIYFSGTGGTARVSSQLEKSLTSHDIEVQRTALDMPEIEYRTSSANIQRDDLLILIFAVHAFDAPEPVYDWINAIPEGVGQSAAVIPFRAAEDLAQHCVPGRLYKTIGAEGYDVFYERMIVMPSNILSQQKISLLSDYCRYCRRKQKTV